MILHVRILLAACFFFASFASAKERPELSDPMKKMFQALVNLQVLASSAEKFSEADHKEVIEKDLETLAGIKHAFPKSAKVEEPGMMAILATFTDYIKDTRDKFQKGNAEYARHRVRTMGTFCLGCHSRVAAEWDYEDASQRIASLKMPDYRKAEFFAATRQFDKAIATYKLLLHGQPPKDDLGVVEYTRALRQYVRLLVRVKQDADGTLKEIDALSKRKDLPEFDLRMLQAWRKDAAFWVSDKTVARDMTSDALVRKAKALVKRGDDLHSYPSDENGDISFLRATSYLHEALDRTPKGKFRPEALYLLGVAYRSLQETYLWDLETMFFEACVRESPHTEMARKCYGRYAEKIYFGYTGSAGTFIPEDELKKLGELRKLSQ